MSTSLVLYIHSGKPICCSLPWFVELWGAFLVVNSKRELSTNSFATDEIRNTHASLVSKLQDIYSRVVIGYICLYNLKIIIGLHEGI